MYNKKDTKTSPRVHGKRVEWWLPDGWSGGRWSSGKWHKALMRWEVRHPPSLLKCALHCGESSIQLLLRVVKATFEMFSRKQFFLMVDMLVCFVL